ncbi:MAG: hypothetical protein L3J44_01645 [Campylobacteraceae bacterium]|nr:hypothetical protein [Campylobacteraceae bacterium]
MSTLTKTEKQSLTELFISLHTRRSTYKKILLSLKVFIANIKKFLKI